MKVILFIGHHKVGSTSLQQFLSRNWAALLKAGILYPATDAQGAAHYLAMTTGRTGPDDEPPINVREAHNALAFKMMAEGTKRTVPPFHRRLPPVRQMLIAMEEQIKALKPDTVVLCAEVFANFGAVNPDLIDRLAEVFGAEEITLYATLRRPDSYLVSWHSQRMKFGHKIAPLGAEGLDHYFPTIHFDYRLMLEAWARRMPRARMVLRDYSDVLAAGGSVDDFLARSGAQFPRGLKQFQNFNPSIPPALMEFARRGNHALDGDSAQRFRDYLIEAGNRVSLPQGREVEMFGPRNRDRLADRFAPIHDWLGQAVGRDSFFPDIAKAGVALPLPEDQANATALPLIRADADRYLADPAAQGFLEHLDLAETAA